MLYSVTVILFIDKSYDFFSYAVKRVVRSRRLFIALFLGVALASTFFSGIKQHEAPEESAALVAK